MKQKRPDCWRPYITAARAVLCCAGKGIWQCFILFHSFLKCELLGSVFILFFYETLEYVYVGKIRLDVKEFGPVQRVLYYSSDDYIIT